MVVTWFCPECFSEVEEKDLLAEMNLSKDRPVYVRPIAIAGEELGGRSTGQSSLIWSEPLTLEWTSRFTLRSWLSRSRISPSRRRCRPTLSASMSARA